MSVAITNSRISTHPLIWTGSNPAENYWFFDNLWEQTFPQATGRGRTFSPTAKPTGSASMTLIQRVTPPQCASSLLTTPALPKAANLSNQNLIAQPRLQTTYPPTILLPCPPHVPRLLRAGSTNLPLELQFSGASTWLCTSTPVWPSLFHPSSSVHNSLPSAGAAPLRRDLQRRFSERLLPDAVAAQVWE